MAPRRRAFDTRVDGPVVIAGEKDLHDEQRAGSTVMASEARQVSKSSEFRDRVSMVNAVSIGNTGRIGTSPSEQNNELMGCKWL